MAVLYVKEQGSYVKKTEERIRIEKNGQCLADVPTASIESLSVIGNVQLTTQVLQYMMQEGIDVSFFSFSGKYIGRLAADSSKNIFLRLAQYKLYENADMRLAYAKSIVRNKIANQIAVIRFFNHKGVNYDFESDIHKLEEQLPQLDEMRTTNEIMGIEGICSAYYFSSFGHMLKGEFVFEKRTRRPPKDPVNVILSLAYTFLTKEVEAVLEAESLETYLGFLHGVRYGRKSLSLDLVEELRQPAVDRLVIQLFNKGTMGKLDFEISENVTLTEDGFKKFCREYEKWMKKPVGSYEPRNFRTILKDQVRELKSAVRTGAVYHPYEWRRDDVSDQL